MMAERLMTEERIASEKQAVRAQIKKLRGELAPEQKKELDRAVLDNLLKLPELRVGARLPVYCYVSVGGEVDTRMFMEILWQRQTPVAVPKVEGAVIRFYQIRGMEDLKPGCMGIPEPKADCSPVYSPASMVITPGLAFTRDGRRIGYGGGFYDKFFGAEPGHERIAVAYPFQLFPELPAGDCDRRVRMLVTSDGIYSCGQETGCIGN